MSSPSVQLAQRLGRSDLWCGDRLAVQAAVRSSGYPELDAVLPGGGWPCGALTELLPTAEGLGELSLLQPVLAACSTQGGWIALVAPPYLPHAPGWAQAGVAPERLLIVQAEAGEAAWASEQLLADAGLAALIAWLPQANSAALRRLQLAAAGRPGLAFLFRPVACRHAASPAPLRLALQADEAGRLRLELFKRRGPPLGRPLQLAIDRPRRWPASAPTPAPVPQPA